MNVTSVPLSSGPPFLIQCQVVNLRQHIVHMILDWNAERRRMELKELLDSTEIRYCRLFLVQFHSA